MTSLASPLVNRPAVPRHRETIHTSHVDVSLRSVCVEPYFHIRRPLAHLRIDFDGCTNRFGFTPCALRIPVAASEADGLKQGRVSTRR